MPGSSEVGVPDELLTHANVSDVIVSTRKLEAAVVAQPARDCPAKAGLKRCRSLLCVTQFVVVLRKSRSLWTRRVFMLPLAPIHTVSL